MHIMILYHLSILLATQLALIKSISLITISIKTSWWQVMKLYSLELTLISLESDKQSAERETKIVWALANAGTYNARCLLKIKPKKLPGFRYPMNIAVIPFSLQMLIYSINRRVLSTCSRNTSSQILHCIQYFQKVSE